MANSIYTVGGAVQAAQGIYIRRRADEELLALCRSGTFAYVLTARQIGKSSLMVSTAERLAELGIRSVIIDLEKFGTQTAAEAWYLDLLDEIADQLGLSTDVVEWWQARGQLGMAHRLADFFSEVLLAEIAAPVIIFVDEIDTTLSLPFADDFYAAVRSLYEARTRAPELKRLSFVLIGVATPGDLIRDSKRTPFNIGQRVDLTDFSFDEALPFAEGLGQPPRKARRLLGWVLHWTGGHPYLTQRLCRALALQNRQRWSKREVAQLVATTFFGEKSQQDNNLQFVRDMLTRRAPDRTEVLTTYRRIYRGRPAVADEEQSIVKNHLKLSGIARREGDLLRVRNQIYQRVFDKRWIKEHLPTTWQERLRRVRRVALAIIVPLFLLSVVLASYAVYYAAEAGAGRQQAEVSVQTAVAAQAKAEIGQLEALNARATAEASGEAARLSAQTAVVAQNAAESLRQNAEMRALELSVQTALDPELGLKIAIEGAHRNPTNPEISRILRAAVKRSHLRSVLNGHTEEVKSAAFSPDDQRIVTTSQDTTTRLWAWNTISGTQAHALAAQPKGVNSAMFSPDGRLIVTAGQDTTARIWEVESGREVALLKANDEPVYSAAFSPDGRLIVTGA
ncbi:MAG TPA: AAA-like domain-containing protein, partial [Roseiflexaceae bacterium]|nr:AAA-like domain-containing protein [Roseiflexaceae bacterium]